MQFHRGMSLLELLIVITIVGIVYAMGSFAIGKHSFNSTSTTLQNLKKNLLAIEHNGSMKLVCDTECTHCNLLDNHGNILTSITLSMKESVKRYGFDRNGDLRAMGAVVTQTKEGMEEACFTYSLHADTTSSLLLLKSGETFYLYTPLAQSTPFTTTSEEALRNYYYNEEHYPMKSDEYYAAP